MRHVVQGRRVGHLKQRTKWPHEHKKSAAIFEETIQRIKSHQVPEGDQKPRFKAAVIDKVSNRISKIFLAKTRNLQRAAWK